MIFLVALLVLASVVLMVEVLVGRPEPNWRELRHALGLCRKRTPHTEEECD